MNRIKFKAVYWRNAWLPQAVLSIDENGVILACNQSDEFNKEYKGYLIPGFHNCHSHAFQYAMAGINEYSTGQGVNDSFWTWRQSMYNLVDKMSPQQIEDIATMLYCQMIANGYTSVAEFHYVHKQRKGKSYEQSAELSLRLEKAAKNAGIRFTLIPVYYNKGGFQKEVSDHQKRFSFRDLQEYEGFLINLEESLAPETILGSGIHSLRSASLDDTLTLLSSRKNGPKHIHISEQRSEVDEFQKLFGLRPIEWLCKSDIKDPINLVHATHMDQNEIGSLIQSPHSVVLCPSTEANLGDGYFPCIEYFKRSGRWSIGSDSHIRISPFTELELLDYGQRLRFEKRNPFTTEEKPNTGEILYLGSRTGSQHATGRSPILDIDLPLDGIVIDSEFPSLICKPLEHILSTIIFTHDARMIKSVLIDGREMIENGLHKKHELVIESYKESVRNLLS